MRNHPGTEFQSGYQYQKGIATLSSMSMFSAEWTTIAAMLDCHAKRFGSRPAILGEGWGCSFRSRKCTRRWQRCHLNRCCRCSSDCRRSRCWRGWMNCSLLGKSICLRPKNSCDTKTDMALSRKFTREIAARAEAGTPASAWDADATLTSCNETVFQDLQPSEEAGR